jgi:cell division protein FtsZ
VKVTLIATGFSENQQSRSRSYPNVSTQQAQQAQQRPQQAPQPQRPQQSPQPPQQPQRQPAPTPQRAMPNFGSNEDLDIPPFLRNRNRGK